MITNQRDGDFVLGPESAECAGVGRVAMDGATLVVDPAEPGLLGRLSIFDQELVASTLDAVLWHSDPGVEASRVLLPAPQNNDACDPSPSLVRLLRLGVLVWLESWSPDALDPVLLDLEIGTAAAVAELASDGNEMVHQRLIGRAPELVSLAERLRDRTAPPLPPAIRALVHDALRLSYESMTEAEPWFDAIEHEHELAMVVAAAGEVSLDWEDRTALLEAATALLGDRAFERALHADVETTTTVDQPATGRSSVDWRQVPRGLLDTGESTVTWALEPAASAIQVSVKAAARPAIRTLASQGHLAFRVLAPDGSLLGIGPLSFVRRTGVFIGQATVSPSAKLQVDVFDPSLIQPPRIGPAAAAAAAERWSARAVSMLRLAAGADLPGGGERAAQLLQYAGRMTEAAAAMATPDEGRRLRNQQAQLLNLLHALAIQEDFRSVRRRAAATLARLEHEPGNILPTIELTASEWALVASNTPSS